MSRGRSRLTKRVVDAFTCPPGRKDALLFDAELKGFGVRATAAGSRLFLFQYRQEGRTVRLPLGEYGVITPDQARSLAEKARLSLKLGQDPLEERRAAARAAEAAREAERERQAREAFTFGVLVQRWHDEGLGGGSRHAYDARRDLLAQLAAWVDRPAAEITRADAREALQAIWDERGESMARHVSRYLHACYNWGMDHAELPANPAHRALALPREQGRERLLTDEEIGAIWRAAERIGPPLGSYVQVLLLTLQRLREVAGMRRAEILADQREWRIPRERMKNKATHIVPLSPQVLALLEAQPVPEGSPLVFTTTGETPVSGFAKFKLRLDAEIATERRKAGLEPAELPPWRFHDFRRAGVTTMARLGVSTDVADRILSHQAPATNSGVKGVYQLFQFLDERRAALDLWAQHVLACAREEAGPLRRSSRQVGAVVALRRKRVAAS
ncbi:MAG: integrase arm-type DNA-binding domain-containing protein [Acetobacteraceae bacterium]|nr:integrase arm-type DNA-binding domain-containing protein [Acetobacteraceae bacterium]